MHITKAAKSAANIIEREIINCLEEKARIISKNGNDIVTSSIGTISTVKLSVLGKIKLFYKSQTDRGLIFIHNHPDRQSPLSATDILSGLIYKFSEVRAVEQTGKIHIVEMPKKYTFMQKLKGFVLLKKYQIEESLRYKEAIMEMLNNDVTAEGFSGLFSGKLPEDIKKKHLLPLSRKMRKDLKKLFPDIKFRTVLLT